eukprot:TRINITY_DN12176_c0_g1_i1.p1 TRINITY_DN12176_c0_g1~~TRINITY_DN12176_c0_g1_i1.p1  ORF type:complete len:327 (-),score=72.77 TRINITY_DN12176_c0_g1_i1:66-1004(-)
MYGKKTKLLAQFERMIESILLHSTGTPLHLIFITEEESMYVITNVLKEEIGKYLSESLIKVPHISIDKNSIGKVPKLKVEFVDIESITSKHREEIDLMKTYFGHHLPPGTVFKNPETGQVIVPTFKYTLDLFYILPFYHQEFPVELEKLIVIDIDLEFRVDLIHLYQQFKLFSYTQLIGVANDQTPHYFKLSRNFVKQNPGSLVGNPGKLQGFNTGVALYNLAKMRASKEYTSVTSSVSMKKLAEKYMIQGTVGDQDWLTVLGWEMEDMFYLLPCQFNVQMDQVYNTEEYKDVWDDYHKCDAKTRILHRNGE